MTGSHLDRDRMAPVNNSQGLCSFFSFCKNSYLEKSVFMLRLQPEDTAITEQDRKWGFISKLVFAGFICVLSEPQQPPPATIRWA